MLRKQKVKMRRMIMDQVARLQNRLKKVKKRISSKSPGHMVILDQTKGDHCRPSRRGRYEKIHGRSMEKERASLDKIRDKDYRRKDILPFEKMKEQRLREHLVRFEKLREQWIFEDEERLQKESVESENAFE